MDDPEKTLLKLSIGYGCAVVFMVLVALGFCGGLLAMLVLSIKSIWHI